MQALLTYPLRMLYLHGPRWGRVGFWEGRSEPNICAELTGAPAVLWQREHGECRSMIDRKVAGIAVLIR